MNLSELRFLVVEDQGFQLWMIGKMLEGATVRDLQRLSGPVLGGVLPRLYPRMLELAYEH